MRHLLNRHKHSWGVLHADFRRRFTFMFTGALQGPRLNFRILRHGLDWLDGKVHQIVISKFSDLLTTIGFMGAKWRAVFRCNRDPTSSTLRMSSISQRTHLPMAGSRALDFQRRPRSGGHQIMACSNWLVAGIGLNCRRPAALGQK